MLSARWSHQVSNKNLDPSERLGLTGPNSVRGFTSNVQSVDIGHLVSLEYKHRFQDTGFTGSMFYDYGQGRINKTPSASSGVNDVTLSSLGLGLGWSSSGWTLQAQWASKQQASTTLTSVQPENQFWFSARYDFKN
jgi:hemolysin activation/secretion protein